MLELPYNFVFRIILCLFLRMEQTRIKTSRPTQWTWQVFAKYSLRYFVSLVVVHLEGRVGKLSDLSFILIHGFDDQTKKKQKENLITGFWSFLTRVGKYPNLPQFFNLNCMFSLCYKA